MRALLLEEQTDPGRRLPTLLDELLSRQRSLACVDVFARQFDEGSRSPAGRVHEQRIPLGRTPGPGEQLAFRVDLDACTGCKACVTACHSLNGLAPSETWRDVGLLVGEAEGEGFQQTVTTACHHCEEPACLAGCPVRAYEKDPVTGIVRHLDDQCIGCQYCVLKCPYDVPKYSAELRIVRKCDMCVGRLAAGEAPACVQGCPNGAISIEIVSRSGAGGARELLPTAPLETPGSDYTRPTTRYVSRRRLPGLRAASRERLSPAGAHDPLALMLVLVQLSVGTLLFATSIPATSPWVAGPGLARFLAFALAALASVMGMGAATLHLGRPLYAFRAVLGWRTSWMSREALAFGLHAPAILLAALASGVATLRSPPAWLRELAAASLPGLSMTALVAGLAGVLCSVLIYVDTRRPAWSLARTAPLFAGTALGLGALSTAVTVYAARGLGAPGGIGLASGTLALGALVLAIKTVAECRLLGRRHGPATDALARSARLLWGPLRARLLVRLGSAAAGGLAAVVTLALDSGAPAGWSVAGALVSLACFTLGEIVERHLYFTSESSPAMPGH